MPCHVASSDHQWRPSKRAGSSRTLIGRTENRASVSFALLSVLRGQSLFTTRPPSSSSAVPAKFHKEKYLNNGHGILLFYVWRYAYPDFIFFCFYGRLKIYLRFAKNCFYHVNYTSNLISINSLIYFSELKINTV